MATNALQNATLFLADILLSLYTLAFLLRGMLALVQADFYNPVSQFIIKVTDGPLSVLRRMLPPIGRFDVTCWLFAYFVKVIELVTLGLLQGQQWLIPPLLTISFIQLTEMVIQIHIVALIILAISSWFMSGIQALNHPVISLIYSLTAPLLNPIRRLMPNTGVLDFSVLAALILLYLLLTILRSFY